MDALLNDLQLVCAKLLPVLGVVVLVFICMVLKRLITLLESINKTVNQLEPTMKLVDESLEKVQAPLDTTVKYSKSLDSIHDKVSSAVSKASKAVSDNLKKKKEEGDLNDK
ncbi:MULTISPECIES: hypothetical protein [Terrabacteria group]|uniref:hypothetical protein n=1 Tax=Bacillati TaxID=1783272 RepID=UPI00193929EE|nr:MULTISPECIES: hypothetical protein [Terrabacteria group]MBW9211890.1 hypothetical protein [Trueperella sp. zg.1013]QRG87307.1 hypothetical protein JOS54_03085 [Bulleidia sp. zg-1006]